MAPSSDTYIVLFPDIVSALLVLDDLIVLRLAAAEGNPARLPRANHRAGAVEVDVLQIFFYLFFIIWGDFIFIFLSYRYYIQHCFICRPSDSTLPTDAGIEPRTVATGALAVKHANR